MSANVPVTLNAPAAYAPELPLRPDTETDQPLFPEPLHVGRPNIPSQERFLARVADILDRRWLTNHGPYVEELEARLAERLGVKHCIAVCNGTVALEIAIRSTGMRGEVIVPSFTFVATAHALEWLGIKPVFCDVDPDTHNIDPASVEEQITPRTTGIIGVHLWGRPAPVEELTEIADRHGLELLFDAAHAFGCSHRGRFIGGFGSAEVLSFHATKIFNTFEGGAILTNDDELAARVRLMSSFGFAGHDLVVSVGTNAKMSEISAAMGVTALEDFDDFVAVNYANHRAYQAGLSRIPGLELVEYDANENSNYQYVVVELDPDLAGMDRDALVDLLTSENVLARRYFAPGCHRMAPYLAADGRPSVDLPATDRLSSRVFALPTGTGVTRADIEKMCALIRTTITRTARTPELGLRAVAVGA